jgi:integrase
MRGSVKLHQGSRGKSWCYVVDAGTDPATAKRRQIKRRGFRTRDEAEAALSERMAELRGGRYVVPSRLTLAAYLVDRWLPARTAALRPSTFTSYRQVIETHVLPHLGAVVLQQIDAATLEAFYGRLLVGGRKVAGTSQALSAKTVRNAAGILSKALADAVKWRLLPHNPARDAELPRNEAPEMQAWTGTETRTFLAHVESSRLAPLWRLALATGMRRGELLGLQWRDVDLAAGVLAVARARVMAGIVTEGRPKTKAGVRRVAIDPATMVALRAWKRAQTEERLHAGPAWSDTGYVFTNELGEPLHPLAVTRAWSRAVMTAGVPLIRLHDARHTAATLMLAAGAPVKLVSQRLGHADIAVTLRVYTHVTAQDDEEAANALGAVLDA